MATEMVMAYGDNGLEPTPRNRAVEIPVLPLAPGNRPIPQTVRALRRALPARLTGIAHKVGPWPYVSWRDTEGNRGVAMCGTRTKPRTRYSRTCRQRVERGSPRPLPKVSRGLRHERRRVL